jgi:hypothetical protein
MAAILLLLLLISAQCPLSHLASTHMRPAAAAVAAAEVVSFTLLLLV